MIPILKEALARLLIKTLNYLKSQQKDTYAFCPKVFFLVLLTDTDLSVYDLVPVFLVTGPFTCINECTSFNSIGQVLEDFMD